MSISDDSTGFQTHGPIYLQIRDRLRRDLLEDRLHPGDFLPTDQALAEQFGVSVGTVKRAMKLLEAESWVQRCQGRGTQVRTRGPGEGATSPRGGKVLVLLDRVRRSFFAEIYSGIQSELQAEDYEPVLMETGNEPQRERMLLERHLDTATGVIIVPCSEDKNAPVYPELFDRSCPVVFVDRVAHGMDHDAVVSENERGGWLAVRYLLELGHERIIILGGGRGSSVLARVEGARRAVEERGLAPDDVLIRSRGGVGFDAAYEMIDGYLAGHPDLTAAFCPRDDAAWGCIQRLHEIGVQVPEQFSVVGYDDNDDICSRIRPRLTTIRQAKHQMGSTAARRLIWRLSHSDMPAQCKVVTLPVELVVRESTAAALAEPAVSPASAVPASVPRQPQAREVAP